MAARWYKKVAEHGIPVPEIAALYSGFESPVGHYSSVSWFPKRRNLEIEYMWRLVDSANNSFADILRDSLQKKFSNNQILDAQYTAKLIAPVLYARIEKQQCFKCHSVDGADMIGPTFNAMFGKASSFAQDQIVDDAYILAKLKSTSFENRSSGESSRCVQNSKMNHFSVSVQDSDSILAFLRSLDAS